MDSACAKKLIRSKSGLRIVTTNENASSPFYLSEPHWTPDKDVRNCMECDVKFDFLRRKHHCRRCGKIYCSSCCDTRIGLPRMCFVDPVRVCEKCAAITRKEEEFFDRQLKTLLYGATFFIHSSFQENFPENIICRLSPDHRHLVFESPVKKNLEPVELAQIKSIGLSKDEDAGTDSVEIVYACDDFISKKLKLVSAPEPHRRTSNSWITAMHQAFKLLYQCKLDNN